jgi:hypothetical protein
MSNNSNSTGLGWQLTWASLDPEGSGIGYEAIEKAKDRNEQHCLIKIDVVELVHNIGHAPDVLGLVHKQTNSLLSKVADL